MHTKSESNKKVVAKQGLVTPGVAREKINIEYIKRRSGSVGVGRPLDHRGALVPQL